MSIYQELKDHKKSISVLGLGYVGLPLALEFAKYFNVIGFDINEERVQMMREGKDPSRELDPKEFLDKNIVFTSDVEDLAKAHFHVVAVPTPIDKWKVPNLDPLIKSSEAVGSILKKGDYIIYESTVYPGATEDDCIPILEKHSNLVAGIDFKVGYSPERINPGDKNNTLTKIIKVVAGIDLESAIEVEKVYGAIISAGVYRAESIKVAEAAKVIENTQRDLNIALMNELSIIFDKMDIDTHAVLKAAETKWNFLKFYPGLVGGHCIGVDPYYLTFKSQKLGYSPQVILSGRSINDSMPSFIAKKVTKLLIKEKINPGESKALVLGLTFKENVSDIRNTKVVPLIHELETYGIKVDLYDPWVSKSEVKQAYDLDMIDKIGEEEYDAIIVAVKHNEFLNFGFEFLKDHLNTNGYIIDIKGIYAKEDFLKNDIKYWRL